MMTKFFTPLIYSLALFVSFFEIIFFISIIERTFGLHSVWGYVGDIEAILLLLFLGGVNFSLANISIARRKESSGEVVSNHFHQSTFLYLLIFFLLSYLIPFLWKFIFEGNHNPGLSGAIGILLLLVAIYGVVLNAIFLRLQKKKAKSLKVQK